MSLSFCPTQIRSQSSSPPQDELLLAIRLFFSNLTTLLKGPPRRSLFFLGSVFVTGVAVLPFVAWLSGVNMVVVVGFSDAKEKQ